MRLFSLGFIFILVGNMRELLFGCFPNSDILHQIQGGIIARATGWVTSIPFPSWSYKKFPKPYQVAFVISQTCPQKKKRIPSQTRINLIVLMIFQLHKFWKKVFYQFAFLSCLYSFMVQYSGILGIEEPHQSNPNLVVKLYYDDNTVGEVLWKNSLMLEWWKT